MPVGYILHIASAPKKRDLILSHMQSLQNFFFDQKKPGNQSIFTELNLLLYTEKRKIYKRSHGISLCRHNRGSCAQRYPGDLLLASSLRTSPFMILSEKDSIQCWCLKSTVKFTQENSQRLKQNPRKSPFHTQLLGKRTKNHCHPKPNSGCAAWISGSHSAGLTGRSTYLQFPVPRKLILDLQVRRRKMLKASTEPEFILGERLCLYFYNPHSIWEKRFFFTFFFFSLPLFS